MKIAILTLPLHTNYGGILQAYALQTVLERMGHEVRVLDRAPGSYKLHPLKAPLSYAKRAIKKYLLRQECFIFAEQKARREHPIVRQHTDLFIDQHLKRELYTDLNLLPKNSYEALVVGSDQIWRPKYYRHIEQAYLAFAKEWEVKRIAYAPSFGTDQWEYSPKKSKECKALLAKFDLVTVREASGVTLCHEHYGIEATHVVDPTLLLERVDYEALATKAGTPKSAGDMLVYVLDLKPSLKSAIEAFADKKGLKSFYTNSKISDINKPVNERIQAPVESWLRAFMDAKLVVTDSFHACVFAIIFNKPFVALGNVKRGMSRFTSLLSLFELEDRLVTSLEGIEKLSPINWEVVNQKHLAFKESCKNLLKEQL